MRTMSGSPCLYYDCPNRNSFGYCKTTACINPKYSNIGTAQYGQGVQKRIITNADRIRSMTDKELAEWMSTNVANYARRKFSETGVIEKHGENGLIAKSWIDWLRQEATVDNAACSANETSEKVKDGE